MRSPNAILLGALLFASDPVPAAPGATSVAAHPARGAGSSPALEAARVDYEAGRLESAIARWAAALPGLPPAARPEVRARIGNAHRKLGHLDVAGKLFAEVLEIAVADRDTNLEALVRHFRGRLAIDRGDTAAASVELARAEALYAARADAAQLLAVRLSLAGVRYLDAAIGAAYDTYTRLLEQARQADDTRIEAMALEGLADCLAVVGERTLAMGLLSQAESLHVQRHDAPSVAAVRARRASAEFGRGELVETARWAVEALADPACPPMHRVQATTFLAAADFRAGRRAAATLTVETLARSLAEPDAGAAATVAFVTAAEFSLAAGNLAAAGQWLERLADRPMTRLHAISYDKVLGAWRLRKGDAQGALVPLKRIHDLEARFLDEFQPELHESLATGLLVESTGTLYAAAVARTGSAAEALAAVGEAKARGTYEVIATAREVLPVGDLLSLVDVGKTRLGEARRRLGIAATLRRTGDPTQFPAIRDGGVVALEYLVTDTQLESFFVTAEGVTRRFVAISGAALEADALAMEAAIAKARPDWRRSAQRLSAALLAPWEKELGAAARQGARLLIVPHGALHRVPFAALPFAGGLLVDHLAEFYLPNLGLAARLGAAEGALPANPSVAAFGEVRDSRFGPLPGARAELEYLSRHYRAVTHRDTRATATALATAAGGVDILHLAVHGIRGDLRRPSYLELDGAGGPAALTAAEVVTSRIPAGLVFLAACESAGTAANDSDEVPGALDRAFLLAGAQAVVSARWTLADRPARAFVETFYDELGARGRLGALMAARRHQRQERESKGVSVLTRGIIPAQDEVAPPDHPYFWAAFALSGEHL